MTALVINMLDLLPLRYEDPHCVGQYGVVGQILRDALTMRKVYEVRFEIEQAKGKLFDKYTDGYGVAEINIDGDPSWFADPMARTFLLSGNITGLCDAHGQPIERLPFDTVFSDVPWNYDGTQFEVEGSSNLLTAKVTGEVAPDWSEINTHIRMRGRGLAKFAAKSMIVSAAGKLKTVE